jgi:ABC-type lipoprotein release transport system permease subunit
MEYTIHDVPALEALVRTTPGVTMVSQRAQSFALVSHGERSFGAQVQGVEPDREARWSSLPGRVISGRYLAGPGEAFIGSALARNLDLAVGDEIVFLGTASEGGVAAAVADVVGIFDSGQVELDRSLAQIPIDDFRAGWGLASDEAHALVILAESVAESVVVAKTLAAELGSDLRVLDWRALMPEAVQTIDLKFAGAVLIFALVATIVTFSVVNTFMMTVFERTPEFGMLMAIGMRPGRIMGQLALEALCLGALGVALGVAISVVVLVPLGRYGLPLPADAAELLKAYQLPDHMYPRFSVGAAAAAGVIMMVGTQVAALIPALRIRKLRPVEALRADA